MPGSDPWPEAVEYVAVYHSSHLFASSPFKPQILSQIGDSTGMLYKIGLRRTLNCLVYGNDLPGFRVQLEAGTKSTQTNGIRCICGIGLRKDLKLSTLIIAMANHIDGPIRMKNPSLLSNPLTTTGIRCRRLNIKRLRWNQYITIATVPPLGRRRIRAASPDRTTSQNRSTNKTSIA